MINCEFENGNQASLRHFVVDALVVKDEKLLLTLRAQALIEGGKWALPGGYVDRDETAYEATRREVLEETGYECLNISPFALITTPFRGGRDDRQNVTMLMLVEAGERVGESDWEVEEMKWVPFDAVSNEPLAFDHDRLISIFLENRESGLLPIVE